MAETKNEAPDLKIAAVSSLNFIGRVLLVVGLLAIGGFASIYFQPENKKYAGSGSGAGSDGDPHDKSQGSGSGSHGDATDGSAGHGSSSSHSEEIRFQDSLLSGRYEEAKRLAEKIHPESNIAKRQLKYELGLCEEGLGNWTAAIANYRESSDPDRDSYGSLIANLGISRCQGQLHQYAECRKNLANIQLLSAHDHGRNPKIQLDSQHILAWLNIRQIGEPPNTSPLKSQNRAWGRLIATPAEYRLWLGVQSESPDHGFDQPSKHVSVSIEIPEADDDENHEPTPPQPRNDAQEQPLELFVYPAWLGDIVVTGRYSQVSSIELLEQLCQRLGVTLTWLNESRDYFQQYTLAFDVDREPLEAVLFALIELHGFRWKMEGNQFFISQGSEWNYDELKLQTRKILLDIRNQYTDHPCSVNANITLANLECENTQSSDANNIYREIVQNIPDAAESALAAHNLGLNLLEQHQPLAAKALFYHLVDHGPQSQHLGWWWLGRSHLDLGDLSGALRAFRKSMPSENPEVKNASILAIALVHLLQGNDDEARKLLQRNPFRQSEPYNLERSIFELYLQYIQRPTELRLERLLETLQKIDNGNCFGPAGVYLAGRIWKQSDRGTVMVQIYRDISAVGFWGIRMTFATAEHFEEIGQIDAAKTNFLAVAAVGDEEYSRSSLMKLAKIALNEGKPTNTISYCRKLLNHGGGQLSEILNVLGQAMEAQGDAQSAAECFAGRIPVALAEGSVANFKNHSVDKK